MFNPNPSIESIGLSTYLDDKFSDKGGFSEFKKRLELGEPKTVIARAFGVSTNTIKKWLRIYEEQE